ncbi:toll/interleukin-1 receptor domain-containing protein [Bordetella genomosp. 13]|uniref:toll/interleukin-1 receptor domain-containing protein n=1 Tax=Bordetella genomosp. 13 TaxID=463040 RepID=UPI0011AB1D4C|nr:toll/interleukin-1 receptor domain-containing protein [Bordetella genomosp. 13]
MATLFFSYCHVDEALRDRLEVHLSLLKREGLVEAWHDRRIVAGSDLDNSISAELERADVVLLLVSADFIASNYCYSVEMERAMERHRNGEARVIPVILRSCDWHNAPFGKLLAVPKDGRAVESWPSQDEALTDVAKAIRKAVTPASGAASPPAMPRAAAPALGLSSAASTEQFPRSSNLRVRKEFSDLDKDTFTVESFKFMGRFFEGSLGALQERHPDFVGRFEQIDARRFTASVYKGGKAVAECTIALGGFGRGAGQITYSQGISAYDGGFNEALSVSHDSQQLFFKPLMGSYGSREEAQLSQSGAAEFMWAKFIEWIQ